MELSPKKYDVNYFQGYQLLTELGIPFRCGILMSYWYYGEKDLYDIFNYYCRTSGLTPPKLFVDSGAYTAMTSGVALDIRDYAAWVNKFKDIITVACNLDVIMDEQKTLDNQHILEDLCQIPILPCYHVLEKWQPLIDYCHSYDYVGLGLAGMTSRKAAIGSFLRKCFMIATKEPMFHGFALTSLDMIKRFHFKSVDSSSWANSHKYGTISLFDRQIKKFVKWVTPTKFGHRDKSAFPLLYRDYRPFFDMIFKEESYNPNIDYLYRNIRSALAIQSYDLAMDYIRKVHNDDNFIMYLCEFT